MTGLELILGHLIGDYIVQNDWMATNKVNRWSGECPDIKSELVQNASSHGYDLIREWTQRREAFYIGHLACTVHCLLYTLAVAAFTFWWMPWWGYLACFFIHWPIDRFRLAREWMVRISGQEKFATGPLSPWSIIIVDNIWHLLTLYAIARLGGAL